MPLSKHTIALLLSAALIIAKLTGLISCSWWLVLLLPAGYIFLLIIAAVSYLWIGDAYMRRDLEDDDFDID